MKKVFIVGTPLFDYVNQVIKSFTNNGFDVSYDKYKIPNRILTNILSVNRFYERRFIRKENIRIKNRILDSQGIDYLLFFGMCEFSPEEVSAIKSKTGARIIFWFIDSVYSQKLFYESINYADLVICYNSKESESLKQNVKNCIFLPLFYDPDNYYKTGNEEKSCDLFFVGALKSRIEYLNMLFSKLDPLGLRIEVYGKLSPFYILLNRSRYPFFFKNHISRALKHSEINRFYNQAHISLNLQPAQATSALNIRTFEVCAGGGLLFTNGNRELLQELFETGRELVYFSSFEELVRLIYDYFGNRELYDYEKIRQNSAGGSILKHTIDRRIKEIISVMERSDG
jgi:spore maturation protein CgeB